MITRSSIKHLHTDSPMSSHNSSINVKHMLKLIGLLVSHLLYRKTCRRLLAPLKEPRGRAQLAPNEKSGVIRDFLASNAWTGGKQPVANARLFE